MSIEEINRLDPEEYPIESTTIEHLKELIKALNKRKAPGHNLSNIAIKSFPDNAINSLLNIINSCLQHPGKRHHDPKTSKNHSLPINHRPISLLPQLSKLLEKIIKDRLNDELEQPKLIPNEQFGFRKSHSAEHQVLRITEKRAEEIQFKKLTGIVYLGIEKAWYQGLLHKMYVAEIQPGLMTIVQSFLKERTFSVRVNTNVSTEKPMNARVPQGSVLGPIFYNIYTHDLPRVQNDTAILAQSKNYCLVTF